MLKISMTPSDSREDWILRHAQERPVARRTDFLDGACGGDMALRQRVEARLGAAAEPGDSPGPTIAAPRKQALLSELPDEEGPGTIIDRYRLLEKIGEGGFGVVYAAEQNEPVKRRVALKIIKLGMDTRQVVARFESERQALALMDHPNIAKVLDAGATASGRPYFVMELVNGEPLTGYCDQHHFTTRQRLDLFLQICHAIQHAHQKGIIHRDIKPSNILVTGHDGAIVSKVIDFGIAKATEQRLTDKTVFTGMDRLIGTPAYMSPEQADPACRDIDTRSDIYSLGVLLYELLTSQAPFDPQLMVLDGLSSVRRTIRELEPVRPSTRLSYLKGGARTTTAQQHGTEIEHLLKLIRGDLDWIVMKCLEKDRTRRYDTANGLAMDIKRHLNHEPVLAGPPSAKYVLKKFIVRNKWPVILNATVAGLTLAGLVGTSLGLRRATLARIQSDQNARLAGQNAARARISADEAKKAETSARVAQTNALRQAYSASMLSASDALERAQIDAARHYLDNAPAELRGWEWRHLSSRLDQATRVHDHPRSDVSQVHVLPDGRSYYEVGNVPTPGIRRYDIETGQLLGAILTGRDCFRSWFNFPANQMVLQVRHTPKAPDSIETWDLAHGARLFTQAAPPDQAPFWLAPDGSRGAYQAAREIYVFDTRSGTAHGSATTVTGASANEEEPMCFEPDGRRLAVSKSMGEVALLDADSLDVLSTFKAHDNSIGAMTFSPDSRLLATGSQDILITDVTTNPPAPLARLSGHGALVTALCFSPDGSLLASCGRDRTLRLWETRTASPRGVFESDSANPNPCPGFLPQGQTLINCDLMGVRFWDVNLSSAWVLRGHQSHVYSVLLSPDGVTIFSGGWDGFVGQPGCLRFWDAATGDLIAATGGAEAYVRATALSRDGSRLAVQLAAVDVSFSRIDILNTATGATIASVKELSPAHIGIDSIAFDPRAENVVWIDNVKGIAHLADARTGVLGKSRRVFDGHPLCSHLAWSPDGSVIALNNAMEPTIELLDAQSLEPVRRWPHGYDAMITSVAFSPDGRRILTTSTARTVGVWDTATGRRVHDLVGHGNEVLCAAYSPDGSRIASGGRDNNVRIWDAETFDQVARLGGHEDYVYSLAWGADSQELISGSGDHTVRIWDTAPMKDRVRARRERQALWSQLEPKVRQRFVELGDADKVVEMVKSDQSLSQRAREVALQVVLRISLDRLKAAASEPRP